MKTNIAISLKLLLLLTIITGALYPAMLTILAQIVFPNKANGSFVNINHRIVGSELIGQKFENDYYFWGRPSVIDYQPLPSAGSNLSMTSLKMKELYENRKKLFMQKNNIPRDIEIPAEMMYSSASGIDPHISVQAARLQMERISLARHLEAPDIRRLSQLIVQFTEKRQLGILGEPRVDVLRLNIELDKTFHKD